MTDNDNGALRKRIQSAQRIVFFTGAGMSAESGIPTFRDALTGLWSRFDVTALASKAAYLRDPSLVWGWYEWRRMKVMLAKPNDGHVAIANFARTHAAKDVQVITQNIDDLHERAGSSQVIHLHGSILKPRCVACGRPGPLDLMASIPNEPDDGRRIPPPGCDSCTGTLRPGVVWFGEVLPHEEFASARAITRQSQIVIVVGTSGVVEPAASLVRGAQQAGAYIVVVDPHESQFSGGADVVIHDTAARTLPDLLCVSNAI